MIKSQPDKTPKKHAQAMVEFALVLPILLLLILGIMETGRLLFIYASTITAAREAVRYGLATGISPNGVPYYRDCDGIQEAARKVGFINTFDDITISYNRIATDGTETALPACEDITTLENGDRIKVVVQTEWKPIIPLFVPLKGFTFEKSSMRTVLSSVTINVPTGTPRVLSAADKTATASAIAILLTNAALPPPAPPVLISPLNEEKISTSAPIPFSWEPSVNATEYLFEISGPSGWSSSSGWRDALNYSVSLPEDGEYIWRVQARNPYGESDWSDSWTLTFTTPAAPPQQSIFLSVIITDPKPLKAGDLINFEYTITKSRPDPVTGIFINQPNGVTLNANCPNSLPLSPPGSTSMTCKATRFVYQADIDSGQPLVNTWVASANSLAKSNEVTTTITIPQAKEGIEINSITGIVANNTVNYEYKIINLGNVTLTNLTVGDDKATIICDSTTLPPNETRICTGSHPLSQSELDAGEVANTGIATAYFGIQSFSDSTNYKVSIGQFLVKSVSASQQVGKVTYTYTIKNTGKINLTSPYIITASGNGSSVIDCGSATSPLVPGAETTCTSTLAVNTTGPFTVTVTSATASSAWGTVSVTLPFPSATVSAYICKASFSLPKPTSSSGGNGNNPWFTTWTINNQTGVSLNITNINIKWATTGNPKLDKVFLPETTPIWITGDTSKNFNVPASYPLMLSTGLTNIKLQFSKNASGVLITITLQEPGCPLLQ